MEYHVILDRDGTSEWIPCEGCVGMDVGDGDYTAAATASTPVI